MTDDGSLSNWCLECFTRERAVERIRIDTKRGSRLGQVIDLSNREDITEKIKRELMKEAV